MKTFFQKFLSTGEKDWAAFIARITLALVIFPHGAQKLFGWWGGYGFSATMDALTNPEGMALPAFIVFLVIIGESLGAIALFFGFFTRFMAGSIGIILLGAALIAHTDAGFFINWYGVEGVGNGVEYHILGIGLALALLVSGGGKCSFDLLALKKCKKLQ